MLPFWIHIFRQVEQKNIMVTLQTTPHATNHPQHTLFVEGKVAAYKNAKDICCRMR